MQVINSSKAPEAIGAYSQATKANGMVFVSGQIPIDRNTGEFVSGGIKEQTRQSLTNMEYILEEAGLTMANVVKVTVLLSTIDNFASMNEVYSEFFKEPYPARAAFAVKDLPKGALVEIEAIACCN